MIGLRSKVKSLRRRVGRMVVSRTTGSTVTDESTQEAVERLVDEPVSFPRVDDSTVPPGAEPIEGRWPKPPGSIGCDWPDEFGSRERLIVRRVARYGSMRLTRQEQLRAVRAGYDDGCLGDYRTWPPTRGPDGWLPPLLLANERWSRSADVRCWEQGFRMALADGRVPGWMGEADWYWWGAGLRNRKDG